MRRSAAVRSSRLRVPQTPQQTGVVVFDIMPTSAANGVLFPMDVLLSIDGQPIGNDGVAERASVIATLVVKWSHGHVRAHNPHTRYAPPATFCIPP